MAASSAGGSRHLNNLWWDLPKREFAELLARPLLRFVEAVAGSENAIVTFQTFVPKGSSASSGLNRILHGRVLDHALDLFTLNDAGAAVTIVVNETDGRGRKAANVVSVRAVFVDCDDGLRVPPALTPSVVVLGREERPHLYFRLKRGEDKGRFTGLQVLLSRYYNGDPVVKDLARCMRVPHMIHWADGSRLKPTAIYAPTWSLDEGGIVRFHESERDTFVLTTDFGDDVVANDVDIPEYTMHEILIAHGYTEADLSAASRGETPTYLVDAVPVDERQRRATAYVEATPGAVEGAGGDEYTFKLACKVVRGFDLDEDRAMSVLERWNSTCVPPWPEDDLRRKVQLAETRSTDPRGYLLNAGVSFAGAGAAVPVETTQPKYVVSLGDFLDEPDDLVPSYWGKGLLDKGTVLFLSGPMQVRKSWFTIQLALMLTLGRSFLGHEIPEPARVLLLEWESGRTKYRERIRQVAAGLGVEPPRDMLFVRKRQSEAPLIGDKLEVAIRECRAEVVILDTLVNFFIGDENSNSDVQNKVYTPLRSLASRLEWSPSFILIHHFGKSLKTGDSLPSRGAAVLEQAAASVLHFELDGAYTKVNFSKIKDAEPLEPIWLAFENFVLTPTEGKPKRGELSDAQRERFRFCRTMAMTTGRAMKTAEFTEAVDKEFKLPYEVARKTAPDAAKHGYLKGSGAKGYYVAGDDPEIGVDG